MKFKCDFCDKDFRNEHLAREHVTKEHGSWLRFIYKTFNVVPQKTIKQAVREDND